MLSQIAHDLDALQEALRQEPDVERTADAIAAIAGSVAAAWRAGKHIVGDIPVPLPRNQGIHPRTADVVDATMSFRFFIPNENVLIEHVFSEIQVCVRGLLDVDGLIVDLEDHWRIDTQPKQSGLPKEIHPLFHFQRGGFAQDAFANHTGFVPGPGLTGNTGDFRGLMQYPGPRIPIAPMCPTTAFDFVLSQHDGPLWRRLLSLPEYADVVGRCQDRLWRLYLDALNDLSRRKMLWGYA